MHNNVNTHVDKYQKYNESNNKHATFDFPKGFTKIVKARHEPQWNTTLSYRAAYN
jgi:hypothetical protein